MKNRDLIVIGGGAAGLFASICAAQQGAHVLLLEKNERPGRKLLITGKGRCNLTNACAPDEVLKNILRNPRFLFSCLTAFPPERVMAFFEKNGCPVKIERGNRVFPLSDRSADVLAALTGAANRLGVRRQQETVLGLDIRDGALCGVVTRRGILPCGAAIVCTGGVSYPLTGSTGDGYRFAREAGHTVIPPTASLVPLEAEADCAMMQGLSLRNTGLKLLDARGRVLFEDFGELLFTHFGVSGPMALSASAHLPPEGDCRLVLDLKPALDEEKLETRFLRDFEKYANRSMEHALADLYPRSMIPVLLRRAGIDPNQRANVLTKGQRRLLLEQTKRFSIQLRGTRPVDEAIITRGGVCVRELDPKTMRSKLVRGLYFAGEVLDCDAYTGGFNLQIAWSTAHAAGIAAAQELSD